MSRFAFRYSLLVAGISALLAAVFLTSSSTSAHFTSCDAVDNDKREMTWISTTIFDAERANAIAQWNAVGAIPINIKPNGNSGEVADVWFRDVTRYDLNWTGAYTCRPFGAVDYIKFNRAFMDGNTDPQQRMVAMHELGHALGLGHSFTGQVMQPAVSSVTTLQSHDIADYCTKWGCTAGGFGGGGGGDDDPVRRMN